MTRGSFRRGIAVGLLVGTVATAVKTLRDRRSLRPATPSGSSTEPWQPLSGTTPVRVPEPEPEPAPGSTPAPPWVDPLEDGGCPETHPVKAKMASGIFHVPGGLNYMRTRADRCYIDASAAEADGLRQSKR